MAFLRQADPRKLSKDQVFGQVPKMANELLRSLVNSYTNNPLLGYAAGHLTERVMNYIIQKIMFVNGVNLEGQNQGKRLEGAQRP